MKKFLTLAAAAGMAFSVANAAPAQKLKLVGKQLSTEDGKPIQLKGFSTFSIHFADGVACLSDSHFAAMKGFGANVVRLAMYVDDSNDGGSYIGHENTFKERVKNYIKSAMKNDLYCVVDWHILETSQGGSGNPSKYKSQAKDFFSDIAGWVVDNGYDGKVMYELCNEPDGGQNFANNIRPYCEEVMGEIIKKDNGALCILGTQSWCQNISDAVKNPVSKDYQSHALYSFHYYACSHRNLLGSFQQAAAMAPVIVSEWSTVEFTGNGGHCESNADALLSACQPNNNDGGQLISWFFWNWGKKNEGSTVFAGDCGNPSTAPKSKAGEYILRVLGGGEIKPLPKATKWPNSNPIPSTSDAPFDWLNFDLGGEGVAYHDGDGAAYTKDKDGNYSGYESGTDEVDCTSSGRLFPAGNGEELGMNPNFEYKSGQALPTKVKTSTDEKCWHIDWGNGGVCDLPGYNSLNAGLGYCGDIVFYPTQDLVVAGEKYEDVVNGRAFEGVDVSKCSGILKGATDLDVEIPQHTCGNICSVEPGEWIKFTVKVEKAGYYKVYSLSSAQTVEGATLGFALNGKYAGNIVRNIKDKKNFTKYTSLATQSAEGLEANDYKNWQWKQLRDPETLSEDMAVVFREAGEQNITIMFNEENGNTGPLYFKFVDGDVEDEINYNTPENNPATPVTVYPNPTSGEFTVALGTTEAAMVQVINMAGQVVYSEAVEGQEEVVVAKALASGVYNVVVSSESGVKTTKLVVK